MGGISKSIRKWVDHPITKLSVGVILFASGFTEAYQNFSQDFSHFRIGARHGVMIIGLINIIASIPDFIDGLSSSAEYLEHLETREKHDRKKPSNSSTG